jgi:8-oxo-dGTP pyrophosphatase MutT (NUDIX family)
MELHGDRNDMPARASATVLLLRDAPSGLEVFLLKRHGLSDVLGGAYVFPGGKVDPEDAELAHQLDRAPEALHAALGEAGLSGVEAQSLFVAAIREVFEETGVLFADVEPGRAAGAWDLHRAGSPFAELALGGRWTLRASALQPWSRWITPLVGGVIRKRFDTRFFVATVPAGQTARHDDKEATEGLWLSPRDALRQYWARAIELAPPQIMSLSHLALHADAASVIEEARRTVPPTVQPEAFQEDGVRVLCYPGDPRHTVPGRALPGPTRLAFRDGRFEPEGGLAALLREA